MMRIVAPIAILVVLLGAAFAVFKNPPKSKFGGGSPAPQMLVESLKIQSGNYTVSVASYGTVQPRTRGLLVAQIGGLIVEINPAFRDGGFFREGDVLVRIDPRDFEADVRIAEATVLDARQALAEAEARTEQARLDWQRLGNTDEPSDLVLRLPQLEAARARLASARSSLEKARLDLSRTAIVAPYGGRVLDAQVDVGQVVAANATLGDIYATDAIEVRLPLRNADLPFVALPETRPESGTVGPTVPAIIRSELGAATDWPAQIVRTESAIDPTARQLHVIARIDDPYGPDNASRVPLKIGQYVTAQIDGATLKDVVVVPNQAIYQGSYAYVVEDGVLQRRNVEIVWQNDNEAIIESGLVAGDELVTTPLGQVTSGVRVIVAGEPDLNSTSHVAGATP
ncbi:MAG: efflux RND transporter periplasmic adaptor subunit [Pseudomonadota bacterium]